MRVCKQLQTAKRSFNRLAFPLLTLSLRGRGKGEGAATIIAAVIAILLFSSFLALTANLDETLAKHKPEATIDLATKQGVEDVKGEWRYSDTKYLYVGNWDPEKKIVMRYDVDGEGNQTNGQIFFNMTSARGEDAIDGVKVDQEGNLYVSGPGGLWIISPAGKHLGTIIAPKHPHNLAWGGEDGKTLCMTAQGTLYRMPLKIPGFGRVATTRSLPIGAESAITCDVGRATKTRRE